MSKPEAPIRVGSTALLGCCELHTEQEKQEYNTCPICLRHIHKHACKERDKLRAVVEWIAAQENLFFAECSQAEEIVSRCREALKQPNNAIYKPGADKPL